jgi:hypothetical protein
MVAPSCSARSSRVRNSRLVPRAGRLRQRDQLEAPAVVSVRSPKRSSLPLSQNATQLARANAVTFLSHS